MSPFDKKLLQLWHLIGLAMIPILYGSLRVVSEPNDRVRQFVDVMLIILGSVWVSVSVLYTVVTGDANGDPRPTLLSLYRARIQQTWFIIASNLVLTVAATYIGYQLLWYRQVEFISNADCILVMQENDGSQVEFGILRAFQPMRIRVPIREGSYVTQAIYDKDGLHPVLIKIPAAWEDSDAIRSPVDCKRAQTSDH